MGADLEGETMSTTTLGARPEEGRRANAYGATVRDLGPDGYVECEMLLSGEATGAETAEGPSSARPFTTRLLVRRPADPARCSGVVFLEWLNVSAGADFGVMWPCADRMITSEGHVWVGVTAQPIGAAFLGRWDPVRYAAISHPFPMPDQPPAFVIGETLSDGVFEMAGVGVREHGERLFGRAPTCVLGYGQSQSCMRIAGYVAGLADRAPAFDGFLMQSGAAAPYTGAFDASSPSPLAGNDVPVIHVNSEFEACSGAGLRSPDDHANYRYWEVPGSGHAPVLALRVGVRQRLRDVQELQPVPPAPRAHYGEPAVTIEYAVRSAATRLAQWATAGVEPPSVDRLEVKAVSAPVEMDFGGRMVARQTVELRRDRHGNARGGVRLPHVEAPAGRHWPSDDVAQQSHTAGFVPFRKQKRARLYPGPDDYPVAVAEACTAAVKAGVLRSLDAEEIEREAAEDPRGAA